MRGSRRGRHRWKDRQVCEGSSWNFDRLFHRSEECGKTTHMWNSWLQSPNIETLFCSHAYLSDTSITDFQEVTYVVQLYPTIFKPQYSTFPEQYCDICNRLFSRHNYQVMITLESHSYCKLNSYVCRFANCWNFSLFSLPKINRSIMWSNCVGHMVICGCDLQWRVE